MVDLEGREEELATLDAMLAGAAAGQPATVVFLGEPGIGKTALLDWTAGRADGFVVLRATGDELESSMPYAALHQLLSPLLADLHQLAPGQRQALERAFALRNDGDADRFAVCLGALGLITSCAALNPLLMLVDDLQWVDAASRLAIRFIARRLQADTVAIVMAAREVTRDFDQWIRPVGPLDERAARALLAAMELSPRRAAQVMTLATGNPLALRALAADPREQALGTGGSPPSFMQEVFERRTVGLSRQGRLALTVAASSATSDLPPIAAALQELGASMQGLNEAAEAGLLVISEASVAFGHPLMRSAALVASTPSELRDVHRALAAVPSLAASQRAWHSAMAATEPDESIAAELETAAHRAQDQGDPATQARLLRLAARITPDRDTHAMRLVSAVDASNIVHRDPATLRWLEEAASYAEDPVVRGEVGLRIARFDYDQGAAASAAQRCRSALQVVPPGAVALRQRLYVTLAVASELSDGLEAALRVIAEAQSEAPTTETPVYRHLRAVELGLRVTAGIPVSDQLVSECLDSPANATGLISPGEEAANWLSILGDTARARAYLGPAMERQRRIGHLYPLAYNLETCAEMFLFEGRLTDAGVAADEADAIVADLGIPVLRVVILGMRARIAATAGREEEARRIMAEIREANPEALWEESTATATARLELALDRPEECVAPLEAALEKARGLGVRQPYLLAYVPDLVEALVGCRGVADAGPSHDYFRECAATQDRAWASAMAARCAGLTCGEREIDRHFQLALRLHGTEAPFDMARTLLAYAERLREAGRRKDALDHASAALKGFEAVGARLWSVRAEEEVRRLGSEPEPVSESAFARLTSQECQVAQLAARGATNKEIGVHLFVSVKTVEYHLRNVYRKLGIRSRTELANVLLSDASLASV